MNTLDRVKAVIGDHAGLPAVMIGDDQPLGRGEKIEEPGPGQQPFTGLDFDSLDKIELALKLGEHFGIEIPDEDVDSEALGTASGLAAYIDGKLNPPARESDWLPPGAVLDGNGGDHAPGIEEIGDGVRVQHEAPEGFGIRDTSFLGEQAQREQRREQRIDRGVVGMAAAIGAGTIYVPEVGYVLETPMSGAGEPDYTAMSAGDMLSAVGTDAEKWTEAFMQSFKAAGEADDGFMTAWFANAIAAGEGYGRQQGRLEGLGMVEPDPAADDVGWESRNHPDRKVDWVPDGSDRHEPPLVGAAAMESLLRQSMMQFRFYERQHRAKGTPEADAKAEVNARYAEAIFEVLNGRPIPPIKTDRPEWRAPEVHKLDAGSAEGSRGSFPDAGAPMSS